MDLLTHDYKEYLTYEELKEETLHLVEKDQLLNLGKSWDNSDIFGCRIGRGSETALVFGFPHPNEPIGSLTCLELIKLLKNNEELKNKYTWYIIPCADPFGAKMNEGWFKGEFSIKKYAYNFYRPEAKRQIEWTFPVQYKDYSFTEPTKETKILMELMHEIKPSLVYPLHNAGLGGAYFYLNKQMPDSYYQNIKTLCQELQIPLDYGEPEDEFIKEQQKPFYWEPHFSEMYEHLKSLGKDPTRIIEGGNNTIGYAKEVNPQVFGLIGEIPYLYDEKILDTTDSGEPREKFMREKYDLEENLLGFILEHIDKDFIRKDNALYPALKELLTMELEIISALKKKIHGPEYDINATVAEKYSSVVGERFHLCTFLGEFHRLLSLSEQTKEVKELKSQTEELINEQINFIQQNSYIKTIPIKKLVQLQLGCLFEAID